MTTQKELYWTAQPSARLPTLQQQFDWAAYERQLYAQQHQQTGLTEEEQRKLEEAMLSGDADTFENILNFAAGEGRIPEELGNWWVNRYDTHAKIRQGIQLAPAQKATAEAMTMATRLPPVGSEAWQREQGKRPMSELPSAESVYTPFLEKTEMSPAMRQYYERNMPRVPGGAREAWWNPYPTETAQEIEESGYRGAPVEDPWLTYLKNYPFATEYYKMSPQQRGFQPSRYSPPTRWL